MAEKGSIRVTVIGTTDVGRVREHNEDNLLVVDLSAKERAESGQSVSRAVGDSGFLLVVADGMGGAASGELASEMAVETVHQSVAGRGFLVTQAGPAEMSSALNDALNAANAAIFAKSQAEPEHRGMGTTMTAAFLLGDTLAVAQVGDSRGYLMRKGKLVQVTKDQSLIRELIDNGTISEEEAEKLGGQNIILQALGVEAAVTVDVKTMEILDGDVLALCSDGLSGMVKDAEIEKTIAESEDLRVACARLITQANDAGGRDNVTVILARFEGEGLRSPMRPLEEQADKGKGSGAATFAPPPPPSGKTGPGRVPIIAGGAGLVVLAVLLFLLAGGSTEVTFDFPAAGAEGGLVPDGGGAEEIPIRPPPGRDSVTLADLKPGKYKLWARLAHYQDLKDHVVEIRRGERAIRVELNPLPGTLVLTCATPRVSVRIRPEKAPASERTVNFATGPTQVVESVPAGLLTLVQSRPGFTSATQTATMPPGGGDTGKLEVGLGALEAILATVHLNLDPSAEGASVTVIDEDGDTVWQGTVPAGGSLTARMRIGSHRLVVTHERYEEERADIEIQPGENTPIDRLTLRPKGGTLAVAGPPGAWVMLGRKGEAARPEQIGDDGRLVRPGLPPGEYEVSLKSEGETVSRSATVRAAETTSVEFPR